MAAYVLAPFVAKTSITMELTMQTNDFNSRDILCGESYQIRMYIHVS